MLSPAAGAKIESSVMHGGFEMASHASGAGGGRRIPWRLLGWGTAASLLLLPLLANAPWTLSDFIVAGGAFAIVGGLFELTVRTSDNLAYRGGVALALAATFLLVWINGAVGIIGSEGDPANLMFFGVIAMAIAGSVGARFRATGMARAMVVAAVAQELVGVAALAWGLGANEPPGPAGIQLLIGFFTVLWLSAAWLFRKASHLAIDEAEA
jgi:hypothetical protein